MKQVNLTRPAVEIHPYVQGRLRALPRHDEPSGILLGTTADGVTRVTGFKRASLSSLRQAALDAGPELAGFYRLQTPAAPTLLPAEEELWQEVQPNGQGVFLLVRAGDDGTEAAAWTREEGGLMIVENISLNGETPAREKLTPPSIVRVRVSPPAAPRRALLFGLIVLAAAAGALHFQMAKPAPPPVPETDLALDLHTRSGELVAAWEQRNSPAAPLQSASLSVQDGEKQQTIDLTASYSPSGRAVIRPGARDIVVTLTVQYTGAPRLSRSATYVGFVPQGVMAPAPEPEPILPDPELAELRKRNQELQEAVNALRKHVLQ